MSRVIWNVVALASLVLIAFMATGTATAETTTYTDCRVREVVDGDTFKCAYRKSENVMGVITVRVRLIDTPESQKWWHKASGTWKPAECWGKVAKNAATSKLLDQYVTVVSHGKDAQGRHLADAVMADGVNFGHWMLAEGHAAIYKANPYLDPEDSISWAAREAGKGMWGGCANPPGHNGRLPLEPPQVAVTPTPTPVVEGCSA